jgi:hypothetical protein
MASPACEKATGLDVEFGILQVIQIAAADREGNTHHEKQHKLVCGHTKAVRPEFPEPANPHTLLQVDEQIPKRRVLVNIPGIVMNHNDLPDAATC